MSFKTIRRYLKYHLFYYTLEVRNFLFAERHVKDCKQIPIIINNYNHYTYLRDLIGCLERRGYRNLYIIDNHSTYCPLGHLQAVPQPVLRVHRLGHLPARRVS